MSARLLDAAQQVWRPLSRYDLANHASHRTMSSKTVNCLYQPGLPFTAFVFILESLEPPVTMCAAPRQQRSARARRVYAIR